MILFFNSYTVITIVQIIGDAHEFWMLLKDTMLQEITAQRIEGDDREHNMLETITTFLNLFKSGFTKKTMKCSVCHETTAERETAFQELLLKFDPHHHENNDRNNSSTLGEMLS